MILNRKKQFFGAVCLLVFLTVFWLWTQRSDHPLSDYDTQDSFVITALSVGKADALILQSGDTAVLIDTGEREDGACILQELKNRGIDRLDLLLITHFDKDHVGSAAWLMEQVGAERVMMPDYEGERQEYMEFLDALEGHSDAQRLSQKTELTLGELQFTIWPAEDPAKLQDGQKEYDNDMSLITRVVYKDFSFLLTGDIEKARIAQMLESGEDWHHDWIKMPHHGRYQKALKNLLEAVQPSAAVICCSEQEPAEEKTLKLLEEKGIPVWLTSKQAVITVCDGKKMEVMY